MFILYQIHACRAIPSEVFGQHYSVLFSSLFLPALFNYSQYDMPYYSYQRMSCQLQQLVNPACDIISMKCLFLRNPEEHLCLLLHISLPHPALSSVIICIPSHFSRKSPWPIFTILFSLSSLIIFICSPVSLQM